MSFKLSLCCFSLALTKQNTKLESGCQSQSQSESHSKRQTLRHGAADTTMAASDDEVRVDGGSTALRTAVMGCGEGQKNGSDQRYHRGFIRVICADGSFFTYEYISSRGAFLIGLRVVT